MPPKVISGGDNPYDIHDAKLSSSATAHESSSVTAHEISNSVSSRFFHYSSAIASISQSTPFGRVLTATQLRAGFELKYCS